MSDDTSNPVLHFGRELHSARLAAGLTLAQAARVIGYHKSQVSRVERGLRAPTDKFARGCDRAFPGRGGWFLRFYKDSRQWSAMPPWFRPWIEHELRAVNLRIWQPTSLSGLLQTEAYALAQLQTFTGATAEQVAERLAARMARQAILTRETPAPPMVLFLVDEAALRRYTGSALIMADQLDRLLALAALPNVTIQVVPNVMHAEVSGGFALAEAPRGPAAYIETALTGQGFRRHQRRARTVCPIRCAQDRSAAGHRKPPAHRRGGNRVETEGNWRKSSYSGPNGGECVEVASMPATVIVRDTQNRSGYVLNVPASAWRAFIANVK